MPPQPRTTKMPEVGRNREDSPLDLLKGVRSYGHLEFALVASRTGRE